MTVRKLHIFKASLRFLKIWLIQNIESLVTRRVQGLGDFASNIENTRANQNQIYSFT